MKIVSKIAIFAITIGLIATSCDYIDAPYTEGSGPINPTDTIVRKILLEDFTGHQCPNCPSAAVIAHQLMELYPGKIMLVTVHAGYFADLSMPNYMTDFRCTESTALDNFFGVSTVGNPNGLINRKDFAGSRVIGPDDWSTKIAELLAIAPDAYIELGRTFNTGTSEIDLNVDVDFYNDFNNPIMVSAYLTEDSIVDYQKNNNPAVGTTPEIADYVHMHVLRGSMNGTWGDTLSASGAVNGGNYSKNLNYTITNATWNKDHMHIVVFVYDATTLEVIQAEEIKLK